MFCKSCGFEIPDDSVFCTNCGKKVADENKSVPRHKFSKKHIKILVIVLALLLVVGAAFIAYNEIGKLRLKTKLMQNWERTEYEDGIFYTLALDFSENTVDYNFECSSSWMNSTIATYKYTVISPNEIEITKVGYKYTTTITIEFFEDDMMIMTPAITSTDSKENWYLH